jgi:deoxyadenosine/deoxycytidine kinase
MKVIYIEGNIGSGKTSLMELLQKIHKGNNSVQFLFEPVAAWKNSGLFDKFYADPRRYAFPFQVMVLTSRIQQLQQIDGDYTELVVMERSLDTCGQVFGKMLHDQGKISDIEWDLYQKLLKQYKNMIAVMLTDEEGILHESETIYVKVDPEICVERIKKRCREGEEGIDLSYLSEIEKCHDEMFKGFKEPLTVIDNSKDLKSNEEWNVIVEQVMDVLKSEWRDEWTDDESEANE